MMRRIGLLMVMCCGLAAACVHRRGYEIADFHVDWADDHTFLVWDARPPSMCCMPMVPVIQVKASKVITAEGPCFDGLYNPDRLLLNASRASATIQLFLLCPQPRDDVAQSSIFRMELRAPSGDRQVEFSVIDSPERGVEITTADGTHGRVRLPSDPSLRQHPELFGALFAFGLLNAQKADYVVTR